MVSSTVPDYWPVCGGVALALRERLWLGRSRRAQDTERPHARAGNHLAQMCKHQGFELRISGGSAGAPIATAPREPADGAAENRTTGLLQGACRAMPGSGQLSALMRPMTLRRFGLLAAASLALWAGDPAWAGQRDATPFERPIILAQGEPKTSRPDNACVAPNLSVATTPGTPRGPARSLHRGRKPSVRRPATRRVRAAAGSAAEFG